MPEQATDPSPTFGSKAFACPHCKLLANQRWGKAGNTTITHGNATRSSFDVSNGHVYFSRCDACEKYMLWKGDEAIWPRTSLAPEAHVDFPPDLISDFEEARQIYNDSPRASAAILRLCLQKLCQLLGAPGKNINSDIQFLHDEFGLGRRVMDSMDILRVVGNNAVHPGEINLDDDRDISLGLFRILNFIVDKTISEPAHIEAIYNKLPEGARSAIESRVAKSMGPGGKMPLSKSDAD